MTAIPFDTMFDPLSLSMNAAGLPSVRHPGRDRLMLPEHTYPGILVTFCGIDGSGKTSMIERTDQYLQARGIGSHRTYTPTAAIRNNASFRDLVDASTAEARERVDVLGMGLQILGDLLQHLKDTIVPRLQQGEAVLCDRYVFTSLAEVRSRAGDMKTEQLLGAIAASIPKPDLAILLDAPPAVAEQRVRAREDERDRPMDSAFIAHQARQYLKVAEENDLLVVSSLLPPDDSFAKIEARLRPLLAKAGR